MSVIIRLQNLPLTASSLDIRQFFHGLSIPDGGVHIVGGANGDAFIAFQEDEDARQAMRLTGKHLKESRVELLLSSRNEMYKVIEQARLSAISAGGGPPPHHQSSMSSSASTHHYTSRFGERPSPPSHHVSSSSNNLRHPPPSNSVSNSMSPTSTGSSANDYLRSITGAAGGQADLSTNPALLFSAMTSIPSASLGASQNAFLNQHRNSGFTGLASNQQQPQGFGGSVSNTNTSVPPPTSIFPNGNPFLIPPPNMAGVSIPFPSLLQGAGNSTSSASATPGSTGGTMSMTSTTSGAMNHLTSNFVNSQMGGHHGHQAQNSLNPFGNNLGIMNNGSSHASLLGTQKHNTFGAGVGGMNAQGNAYGAGIGANNGDRPQFGRPPFGNQNQGKHDQNNFQFGAIPSGRADLNSRDNANNRRGHSPPRDRRGGADLLGDSMNNNRRRRSRSRERERGGDHRRPGKRSRSRSRSPRGGRMQSRRDSRDHRDPERRSRSDSSPEKSSQESGGARRRMEHEPSPVPTSTNTTTEEWPGAKLSGIPSDASYREIKEFIRVDVMGGSDGVVRLYDEGIAYLKLENASEFPRVFRSNLRKLRGSVVSIEGITMEIWTQEYKLNKSRLERDIDREFRERGERDRERRGGDRDKDHGRDRDRHVHSSHSSGSSQHRSSRFSNATMQASCIAIRGLSATVTRQELVSRYLHDTPCEDIVLIAAPTPTNRHSVTAFVQFESAQTAQAVIDGIVRSPIGTQLVVETCDIEDLQRAKARTSGTGPVKVGAGMNSPGLFPAQDAKSIFDLDLGLDDETTTIIMKGAPPNITERDVFDFFSDIGLAPMNVRILYDTDGQCSGQVICEFPDNNKAKRATTKDGMMFGRGQISVSLLPSRNKKPSAAVGDFGGQSQLQQPNLFNRNPRPGLLGPAPRGGGAGGMSRFPNPTSSPNIFEQALQLQSAPMPRLPMGGEGGRGRPNGRGRGERMSRFSNNDNRNDFRNQNGAGRGRGGNNHLASNKKEDTVVPDNDDMALFNKKGCVIGLENLPYKSSMDDILQYLEDTLKIRISPDRIIRRYDDNQKPTGDARVAFDTEFEAKLARERLIGTYMWTRLISARVIEEDVC